MSPFAFGTAVSLFVSAVQAAQAAPSSTDDGLTLGEIVDSVPLDPASLVALALMAAFVFGVLWFGTRSGGAGKGTPPA